MQIKKAEKNVYKKPFFKTALCLVVLIIIVVSLFSACAGPSSQDVSDDDNEIVIAMTLMNYGFPFFQDMLAMAKLTADQLGVKLIDLDGSGSVENQADIINDFLYAMDVDVICLNPVDSDAISSLVLEANELGVPVVTVDVGTISGQAAVHIASDNLEIGRTAARYTVELLTEKYGSPAGTVIAVGYPQISSMRLRLEGYMEILNAYPDIKIITKNPIKLNSDQNLILMEDLIQSYPEGTVDIVFGASGTTTTGLLAATEAAKRTDYLIISVDNPPEILNKLNDPNSVLAATVVQSPADMGREAIEACVKIARGEEIDQQVIHTPIELVTKQTIGDYLDRMEAIYEMIEKYKH